MLTLKITAHEATHWIADVTEVSRVGCGARISSAHENVINLLNAEAGEGYEYPEPSDDVVWHIMGGNPSQPDEAWYCWAVAVKRSGDKRGHYYAVEDQTAYLMGPDGKTIDRI